MKTVNNIVVFENENCFLALMKGYCYANHISMTEADFNVDGINEVEKLKPALIIIPLDWISAENKNIEIGLLRRVAASGHIKVCGLNKDTKNTVSGWLPAWVDVIINNPLDISEIDRYIRKNLLFSGLTERRVHGERRSNSDRRRIESHTNDYVEKKEKETKSSSYMSETTSLRLKHFQIDQRTKCVFLKGHKIDLTPKEFELFELLSMDVDRVFTADEIINHLWPESNRATKADLYQHMHLLRKKVENDPNNPQWIVTVKGFGYKLNIGNLEESNQAACEFVELGSVSDTCMPINILTYLNGKQ